MMYYGFFKVLSGFSPLQKVRIRDIENNQTKNDQRLFEN